MGSKDQEILFTLIRYAKKFGFISRSFFWSNFCQKSRATNFRYWSLITNSGAFLPYRDTETSAECFYVNSKSAYANKDGILAVSKRNPFYIYHDEKIMNFIYAMESMGLVRQFWTEQELRCDRSLAWDVLGGEPERLPDLVFEVNVPGPSFRVALEIETTRKTSSRYYQKLFGYSQFKNIDLVIFGAEHEKTKKAIHHELSDSYFNRLRSKTAFYMTQDFENQKTKCKFLLNDKSMVLEEFFNNFAKLRSNKFGLERDKNETLVSSANSSIESEEK